MTIKRLIVVVLTTWAGCGLVFTGIYIVYTLLDVSLTHVK